MARSTDLWIVRWRHPKTGRTGTEMVLEPNRVAAIGAVMGMATVPAGARIHDVQKADPKKVHAAVERSERESGDWEMEVHSVDGARTWSKRLKDGCFLFVDDGGAPGYRWAVSCGKRKAKGQHASLAGAKIAAKVAARKLREAIESAAHERSKGRRGNPATSRKAKNPNGAEAVPPGEKIPGAVQTPAPPYTDQWGRLPKIRRGRLIAVPWKRVEKIVKEKRPDPWGIDWQRKQLDIILAVPGLGKLLAQRNGFLRRRRDGTYDFASHCYPIRDAKEGVVTGIGASWWSIGGDSNAAWDGVRREQTAIGDLAQAIRNTVMGYPDASMLGMAQTWYIGDRTSMSAGLKAPSAADANRWIKEREEREAKSRTKNPRRGRRRKYTPLPSFKPPAGREPRNTWTVLKINNMLGPGGGGPEGYFASPEEAETHARVLAGRTRTFMTYEVWKGTPKHMVEKTGFSIEGTK